MLHSCQCHCVEKCPNTDYYLVRIQSESGKYGSENAPYLDTFHAVLETHDMHDIHSVVKNVENRKNLDSTGSLGGKNITFNINPVQSGVTYLYPLKNQKKLSFFLCFQEV